MNNRLINASFKIAPGVKTIFINENDIYQDGTLPAWRDGDGMLWALSGHTHLGHIGVFSGQSLGDMEELYRLQTNFVCGRAGNAFDRVKYPEGVMPRGSIWPFGLWIHEKTGRFYAFFHNETGWNAGNTGYTAFGKFQGEPDFRHIGLMHSDDQGRTWDFNRWVLTSYEICYTELYRPDGLMDGGQKEGIICLGAGDFSIFVAPDEKYLYIFYTMLRYDMTLKNIISSDVYVARTEIREDGRIGDFIKFYNGQFCQPGNMGKEEIIVQDAWHPHIVYSSVLNCYIMSSTGWKSFRDGKDALTLRTSDDLINWSEPIFVPGEGERFKKPYFSIINSGESGAHNIIGDRFTILVCHNGTDLMRYDTIMEL